MSEVVRNPQTGNPAVAETVYRDLELSAENSLLDQLTTERDELARQAEAVSSALAAKESQLTDQKSLVEGINSLTVSESEPGVAVDEWTTGASSEEANTEEVETVLL